MNELRTQLLTTEAAWKDPMLRRRWHELVQRSSSMTRCYASPEWFDHLRETAPGDSFALLTAADHTGYVHGLIPIRFRTVALPYTIAARALWKPELRAAEVLGSNPLADPDVGPAALLDSALAARCDCLYLDALPADSPWWHKLRLAVPSNRLYTPGGERPWFAIELQDTVEKTTNQIHRKARASYRRQSKRLAEHAGTVRLHRYQDESDVDAFVAAASHISAKSWQHNVLGPRVEDSRAQRRTYVSLARRGLFRSYVLYAGDRPVAFGVGCQGDEVYHYNEMGYDAELINFSPGAVLLYMLIEDLVLHQPARFLNFGVGDADYKRWYGNIERRDVGVFIFTPGWRGQMLRLSHAGFRGAVQQIKAIRRMLRTAAV